MSVEVAHAHEHGAECSVSCPVNHPELYPGQRGYACAVFAVASRKLPPGAVGGTAECFAAIDDAIAEAIRVERLAEREACARVADDAASVARDPEEGCSVESLGMAILIASDIRARR